MAGVTMSKGFPFLTLTLTFVVVLLLEATHVFAQTPAPSQESNHPSFTVPAVSPSTPRKNDSVRATNHNPPSTSRGPSNPANGGGQHMFPATNDNRRLIVDTVDVDLNHDDCIGGDVEMAEFVKRVASALKEFGNADWRAMGVAKRADVNGDGRICWCDFIAIYLKDKVLGLNHEFPFLVVPDDVMFNQLDADGDGKLEGKERDSLQAQFASCMTPRQAQSIVDAMSLMADLDKSITLQEYRAFFSHRYRSNRPKQMSPRHQQQQQQQLQQQPRQQQPQQVDTESQWQEELDHLQQDPASPKRSERLEQKRPSDVSLNNRLATPQSQQQQRQPVKPQHQQHEIVQTDQEDQLLGVELDLQQELLQLQEQQEQQQDELQQLEQLQQQRDLQQKQHQLQQQQQHQQQQRRQQQQQPPQNPNAKHAADMKNLEKSPAFYQKWYRQQLGKLPGSRYAPRPPALAPSHPSQPANPSVRGSPHANQFQGQGQAVRQHDDDNKPEAVLNQDATAKSSAGMAETEPQNPKINHRR